MDRVIAIFKQLLLRHPPSNEVRGFTTVNSGCSLVLDLTAASRASTHRSPWQHGNMCNLCFLLICPCTHCDAASSCMLLKTVCLMAAFVVSQVLIVLDAFCNRVVEVLALSRPSEWAGARLRRVALGLGDSALAGNTFNLCCLISLL